MLGRPSTTLYDRIGRRSEDAEGQSAPHTTAPAIARRGLRVADHMVPLILVSYSIATAAMSQGSARGARGECSRRRLRPSAATSRNEETLSIAARRTGGKPGPKKTNGAKHCGTGLGQFRPVHNSIHQMAGSYCVAPSLLLSGTGDRRAADCVVRKNQGQMSRCT